MNVPRETIWAALFARFNGPLQAAGYVTVGRRLKHWNDVPKETQPYFCMAQGKELVKTERGQPSTNLLTGDLYIYARTDGGLDPGPIVNPLVDAVEAALAPGPAENVLTLGGIVHWCRIDGTIETDEGTLGDQSVVVIPIAIYL